MQSIAQIFESRYKQLELNTLLLILFMLWTILILVTTWNIQHSSEPMFCSQQVQLSSGHVAGINELGKNVKAKSGKKCKIESGEVVKPKPPDEDVKPKPPDEDVKPKPPDKDGKTKPPGKDNKTEKELIAIGAGAIAALAVPLLIAEAPAIAVAGIGIAVWLVVRMSFNTIF